MTFTERYDICKREFETRLSKLIEGFADIPHPLRDAMAYSLSGGGKRLRPLLLLEAVGLMGGKADEAAIKFALAVECIHTYSLIHDDLPCMDDDDLRRGRPTCHVKFGESTAVLAGDALLNLSYELILQAVSESGGKYVTAGNVLAQAASSRGLIGGQICDLKPASESSLDYIYDNKTGALIRAALVAGALIGGATNEQAEAIGQFGRLFGYCFQLRDDLLDKDVDSKDKNTYLNFYGEDKTRADLEEKSQEAIEILKTFDKSEFLTELTKNFITRTK